MTEIQKGSKVVMHYTITLVEDSHVADSTREGEPCSLVIGQGDIIEGLENRLLGLKAGDEKQFKIPCMEAYGPKMYDRIHKVPKSDFSPDMELEEGLVVGFRTPNDEEVAGVIIGLEDDEVEVDFSHPLAGQDILFDVGILEVHPPE